MKKIFSIILVLLSAPVIAQPVTPEEVKKHKIRKVLVTEKTSYGTTTKFWIYNRNGLDSLKSNFEDTSTYVYTFKNGKLINKRLDLSGKPGNDQTDQYTYEYNADGSYKETYQDGSFGMKSYQWYDAKGKLTKSQSPDGNTTNFSYNPAGKIVSSKSDGKNGGVKSGQLYTYNAKGQLVKRQSEVDGMKTVTSFEYDTKGKLVRQKINWSGETTESVTTFEYNEKGLLKKSVMKDETNVTTTEYEYEYYNGEW